MALYLGSQKISSVLTTYGTLTFDSTDATAAAEHIQLGYTAYASGQKITGTMDPNPAKIKAGEVIAGVTGTFTSDANATAAQIQSGKTAYVNGVKVTGTLAPAAANIKTGVTIAGVAGTFTADATATAAQILNGKTAYVNGSKVTGTALATATTATAAYIRKNYTAYNNSGTLLTGTMAEYTTAAQSKTPSTTKDIAVSLPAGYYPNDHTVTIKKATGGSQVVTGTINASSNVYTISTSFTPKGFMMVSNNYFFDGDLNTLNLYALNSTTVSGYYEQYSTGTGKQTIAVSMYLHSNYHPLYDTYPTSDYGSGTISTAGITSDLYASALDTEVTNITTHPVSWFTEDSTLLVGDLGWSAYMSEDNGGVKAYAASATVVYSATAATITVDSDLFCPPMTYVCWG